MLELNRVKPALLTRRQCSWHDGLGTRVKQGTPSLVHAERTCRDNDDE